MFVTFSTRLVQSHHQGASIGEILTSFVAEDYTYLILSLTSSHSL